MSKLMNIDKQLEKIAKKWYKKEYYGNQIAKTTDKEMRREFQKGIEEEFKKNKKVIIKEYLEKHPKIKKDYEIKKARIKKLKVMAGMGMLSVAVLGGTYTISNAYKQEPVTIETQDHSYDKNIEENLEKDSYDELFEKIDSKIKENDRDEAITEFTKEKMVEAYNKEHKENPITAEQLEYYHLNETVIANKDNFNNDISYERTSQTQNEKLQSNQELKKIQNGLYEFKIDGKTVAVYDATGVEIKDNSIENKEDFKDCLEIIKQSEKLQNVYKYMHNENDVKKEQKVYKETAEKLIVQKEQEQKQELNR